MVAQSQFDLRRIATPLDGFTVVATGEVALPVRICVNHLALLGAEIEWKDRDPAADPNLVGEIELRHKSPGPNNAVQCAVYWRPQNERTRNCISSESIIQALSGLMEIHGRDRKQPRRLGLEVASIAAGIIAAQGVLASVIANRRGSMIRHVEVSVLQAALLLMSHHLAIATSGDRFLEQRDDDSLRLSPDPAPGPPFCTADDQLVELETLSYDGWAKFWTELGVSESDLDAAWSVYVFRYLSARCLVPRSLHEAVRLRTFVELREIAHKCGLVVCCVRSYPAVLTELQHDSPESDLGRPWLIRAGERTRIIKPESQAPAVGPLVGLTVIDITTRLQGPLAGHLLRALGSHVIKVERPGGDIGRARKVKALNSAYIAYNRGKELVEIDYKNADGREQLLDLAAQADVCLHNWPPGRAEKLSLNSDDFASRNLGLVYAHASGWGSHVEDGPGLIAGDFLVQAHAGCCDGLNSSTEPLTPSRLTFVDLMGGLFACEGILAGLYLREDTDRGCRVDTSLFRSAVNMQTHIFEGIGTGKERGRHAGKPLWTSFAEPLETADGFLVVEIADESALKILARVCGLEVVAGESTSIESIRKHLRTRSAGEWEQQLLEAKIPVAVVCTNLSDLPNDSSFDGLLEQTENGCWIPRPPWRFIS